MIDHHYTMWSKQVLSQAKKIQKKGNQRKYILSEAKNNSVSRKRRIFKEKSVTYWLLLFMYISDSGLIIYQWGIVINNNKDIIIPSCYRALKTQLYFLYVLFSTYVHYRDHLLCSFFFIIIRIKKIKHFLSTDYFTLRCHHHQVIFNGNFILVFPS